MSATLILTLLNIWSCFLAIDGGYVEIPACPPNEIFKIDQSSTCGEDHCFDTYPRICTLDAVSGCFCAPGYMRNEFGICVAQCTSSCPLGEEWSDCGSTCLELKCNQTEPQFCPKICQQGCFCKPGYARNNIGICVDECLSPCSITEQWSNCGSYCLEPKCGEPNPFGCPAVCQQGCFCKPGYVRDELGNCVTECSSSCSVTEEWNNCGSLCFEKRCEPIQLACPAVCVPGCYCKPGFIRNAFGICASYC